MMDRAVLDAYGWADIQPTCEFFPEFDEEDEDDSSRPGRTRQAKYRYRWPEEIHDEVLAELLALNRERAQLTRLNLDKTVQDPIGKSGKVARSRKG